MLFRSQCVNTATDNNNCGGCGHVCTALQTCVSGVCTAAATCSDGIKNGTETDIDCGGTCPKCATGKHCVVGSDCMSNVCCGGVCVDTTSDINNCGGCGRACNTPNGTSVCSNGTCGVGSCNAGFANCDGNAANGCETFLMTDPHNCGTCGNACATGYTCVSGVCIA